MYLRARFCQWCLSNSYLTFSASSESREVFSDKEMNMMSEPENRNRSPDSSEDFLSFQLIVATRRLQWISEVVERTWKRMRMRVMVICECLMVKQILVITFLMRQ